MTVQPRIAMTPWQVAALVQHYVPHWRFVVGGPDDLVFIMTGVCERSREAAEEHAWTMLEQMVTTDPELEPYDRSDWTLVGGNLVNCN